MADARFTAWEFFAGGGMARAGLGAGWRTAFANDIDAAKAAAYADNFGAEALRVGDVWRLAVDDMPCRADLAWASSPCQDFSLAGGRVGLEGGRSSALLGFLRLMRAARAAGLGPRLLVIENVVGLLTSAGGRDFAALCQTLTDDGWRFGAVELDAARFTPQSRPRLFIVAARKAPDASHLSGPPRDASPALQQAHARLSDSAQAAWVWWRLPPPPRRNSDLASVLDIDAPWDPPAATARLLSLCGPLHRARLDAAATSREPVIAAAYRRIRLEHGAGVQRTELRFDGLAGCLRTPAGGSSRQFVVEVRGDRIRSRHLTAREGARLMGLPDDYRLPTRETTAWRILGDGVCVPAVRWLAASLLEPLLSGALRAAA